MPRARKHSPIEEPPQSGQAQTERLIEAVQTVAGEIECLRNALDDILVELQWHIRNYKDHIRCLVDVLERTSPTVAPVPPDADAAQPSEAEPAEDLPAQFPAEPSSSPAATGRPQQRGLWHA